jgi:hypothetical protein
MSELRKRMREVSAMSQLFSVTETPVEAMPFTIT